MKFEIIQAANGKAYVNQVNNGRVLNTSEQFERKAGAMRNVNSVVKELNPGKTFQVYDFIAGFSFEVVGGAAFKAPFKFTQGVTKHIPIDLNPTNL